MPFSTAAKNIMLDAIARGIAPATSVAFLSLHTANPGDTGANEVSGGTPAYARKAITFNPAAAGAIDDATNGVVFDVPAGTTVTHVGFWSAATGGTWLAYDDVTAEAFASQGTYTATDADLALNL